MGHLGEALGRPLDIVKVGDEVGAGVAVVQRAIVVIEREVDPPIGRTQTEGYGLCVSLRQLARPYVMAVVVRLVVVVKLKFVPVVPVESASTEDEVSDASLGPGVPPVGNKLPSCHERGGPMTARHMWMGGEGSTPPV